MKDLNKAINDAVEEMDASGKIQEMINENAESMIKGLIRDAFQYNSPIIEKVKQAINDSLDVDLTQVDFSKHNTAMIHAVSESFKSEMLENQVSKMKEKIAKIFGAPEKKEYTIVEFVNSACERIKAFNSNDYDEDTEVRVSVKKGICGWDFDLKVGGRFGGNGESIRLVIGNENKKEGFNKIWIIHNPDINLGVGGGIEQWIYGLYSHGIVITGCENFNERDCDLTVWEEDEEEEY